MSKNKFYIFLSLACLVGYSCLAYCLVMQSGVNGSDLNMCLFKHVTGLPCPSCGSTRAAISLMHGDIYGSLLLNPFGLILVVIMVSLPVWILYDLLKRKATLFRFYNEVEIILKRRWIALPAVMLVLGNWAWNIYKGL